jgi:flagellar motility protein MotE (MotC chaperone)
VRADSTAARTVPPGKLYGPTPSDLAGRGGVNAPAIVPANTAANSPVNERGTSVNPADSVQSLRLALEDERRRSAALAEQLRGTMDSSRKAIAVADSGHAETRKSMAKVLEAMDPSSAARILKDYPDGDVKQMILTMKKRQAAKILAALEPDRAARIMR